MLSPHYTGKEKEKQKSGVRPFGEVVGLKGNFARDFQIRKVKSWKKFLVMEPGSGVMIILQCWQLGYRGDGKEVRPVMGQSLDTDSLKVHLYFSILIYIHSTKHSQCYWKMWLVETVGSKQVNSLLYLMNMCSHPITQERKKKSRNPGSVHLVKL